ncbi:MAG: 2-C-methyl-D-erythritol 4-phosphate cytidylyltransferase [Candidatus Binatia bacterium]|nr:MAG: 2-C-methyl-D-erythritol 4-phosphate cytidylyltransferase [Candidatus Binatia bacterium]
MEVGALVAAAGQGTRLGETLPKAFVELEGRPLLWWTVSALARSPHIGSLTVAVPAGCVERASDALREIRAFPIRVVEGGATRQESVYRALRSSPEHWALVLVHDAARPFVSPRLVEDCIHAAAELEAVVAALPVTDTIKEVDSSGKVLRTLDRVRLRAVQTPQVFRRSLLAEAHERARQEGYRATDDAALVERLGRPVWVVRGSRENRKITTPEDLDWARSRLRRAPR